MWFWDFLCSYLIGHILSLIWREYKKNTLATGQLLLGEGMYEDALISSPLFNFLARWFQTFTVFYLILSFLACELVVYVIKLLSLSKLRIS